MNSWLAKRLGKRYGAVVSILDRALTAFAVAFGAKLVASGLDVTNIVRLSYWQTAALAGLAAALSVAKSAIMTAVTGDPALLSLTSKTLRARRAAGRRPEHAVPLRPPT